MISKTTLLAVMVTMATTLCRVEGQGTTLAAQLDTDPPVMINPCTIIARMQNQYYFAYDANNTKFVQCDGNFNMFVRDCPPGEVWSQARRTCIRDSSVTADLALAAVVTCSPFDRRVPDPCSYTQYYVCVHGNPVGPQPCAPGTQVNQATGRCDFSFNTAPLPAYCT